MVIISIIALLLLIMFHELGHFLAAKAFNVKVNEFSVGMGPAIYKKQGKETLYSIRLLPIGGYVAIEGEGENSADPRSLDSIAKWKKCIVMLSGILVNLLIGYLLVLSFVLGNQYFVEAKVDQISVQASDVSQLVTGDQILSVNGFRVFNVGDIDVAQTFSGETLSMVIKRDGSKMTLTDVQLWDKDRVSYIDKEIIFAVKEGNFLYKTKYAFLTSCSLAQSVVMGLKLMISGNIPMKEVSGPVGIVSQIAHSRSWFEFFYLIAFISINLGVMNLVPLPALDGGQTLITIAEMISRKTFNKKILTYINMGTLSVLLLLMFVISVFDVVKMF